MLAHSTPTASVGINHSRPGDAPPLDTKIYISGGKGVDLGGKMGVGGTWIYHNIYLPTRPTYPPLCHYKPPPRLDDPPGALAYDPPAL